MSYTPRNPDGLAFRVCAWFQQNSDADEELTRADIALRWDVPASSVDGLLAQCIIHGYLDRARSSDGTAVIKAGPKLKNLVLGGAPAAPAPAIPPAAQAAAPTTPAPSATKPAQRRGRVVLPPLQLSQLKIERGVPLAPARRLCKQGETRYDEVFAALKPNESVVVPRDYVGALKKAVIIRSKHHGGKFLVRLISETEARLYRTE